MDNTQPERTMETMPGYKPLRIVPWKSGYGCDILCGEIRIATINEGFRNQYRAEFSEAYTPHRGWRNTHEYCFDEKDALEWIRKQWCAFLVMVMDPSNTEEKNNTPPDATIFAMSAAIGVSADELKRDLEKIKIP